MDFIEARKLLKKYKIPFSEGVLARNEKEAVKAARKLGFPLAMKIVSSEIIHKTDVGGVEINIQNEKEAVEKFNKIMLKVKKKAPKAKIEGIFIQKFVEGQQLIIGGKMDSQFGPIILFGLGGIFVEVMKDFSIRVCPITKSDAKKMVREIKGFPLLKGIRGKPGVNLKGLEEVLLKVNKLMLKEKLKELDLNPVIANEKKVVAVDVRVI